jgi:hypothetical protein
MAVCALVLVVVPITLLNPMGRSAFLGYYLGIATMWLVVAMGQRLHAIAQ